ncbi:taurine dioxygenase [Inquilinus limosus]|uniref:taurine dioxygenase n=1 Tax=Inquilinus limosus TaxID=171674 RepID=UPI003F146CE3
MPDSLSSTLFSIQPLNPAIGAVVRGIDLAQPLGDTTIAAINRALLQHHVLFFEDQELTPAAQRDFAARFGPLHVHPVYPHVAEVPEIIILDTHPGNQPDNDNWHTDVTFIETPPLGAVLAAKELPPSGGDTTWSSSIAAFEALSPPWQGFLTGLTALHDFARSFPPERFSAPEERERWQIAREKNPPVIHPVVRTHPVTGRKGLFVNEGFTIRITGFSTRESDTVLRFLFEHVARPEFTVRWRWKPGDVAFWDNRCTQHYALADYLPHRRVMHRATILGDRPV